MFLRGRLAEAAQQRELPSGDVLISFRLTVARPPGERARVDSIECVTTRPAARRTLERAQAGEELELTGSLRRRFWRSPGGTASRYSVDVASIRLNRSGRRAGASPGRRRASG